MANPPFHMRMSICGSNRCKIDVPFLSKIIRLQDFGDGKVARGQNPLPKKILYLVS